MALAGWDIWAASTEAAKGAHSQQAAGQRCLGNWHRTHQQQPHCKRRQGGSRLQQQQRRRQQAAHAHLGGAGALGPPVNGQLLRVMAAAGIGGAGREEVGEPGPTPKGVVGSTEGDSLYLEFPPRAERAPQPPRDPPLIRVRLSVHYRVHSRQMLCIGGSQIPFGWSFLSIAKVPMQWSEGDIWSTEFDLPAGSKVEYKYVIMEEQDWTSQVSEDAEGIVSFRYRTQPDDPPDVQTIQKQMAIVAWQPGPNRIVQVPDLEEVESLKDGEVREREPARQQQSQQQRGRFTGRQYGQQAYGQGLRSQPPAAGSSSSSKKHSPPEADPLAGTWETLALVNGEPLLERRDVWGLPDPAPRLNPLEGLRFDS